MARKSTKPSSTSPRRAVRNQDRALAPQEKIQARKQERQLSLEYPAETFLDGHTKNVIIGIIFILLGLVIFVMCLLPNTGIVARQVSHFLLLLLGKGAYLFPFIFFVAGSACISMRVREMLALRLTLGAFVIFFALLILCALATPVPSSSGDIAALMFNSDTVVAYGGYIGALFAWMGLITVGVYVSIVIALGIMFIGATLIGFSPLRSLAALHSFITQRKEARAAQQVAADCQPVESFQNIPVNAYDTYEGYDRAGSDADVAACDVTQAVWDPTRIPLAGTTVLNTPVSSGNSVGKHQGQQRARRNGYTSLSGGASDQSAYSDAYGDDPTSVLPLRTGQALLQDKAHCKSSSLAHTASQGCGNAPTSSTSSARTVSCASGDSKQTNPHATRTSSSKQHSQSLPSAPLQSGTGAVVDAFSDEDDSFELPSMTLLKTSTKTRQSASFDKELAETAARLQQTLADFGIMATVVDWIAGPTVTLFEIDLPAGVRVSRIMSLSDDIALALAAPGVRIFAPIPRTHYVGIEVPNATRENVFLGDILKEAHGGPLEIAIGKDVEGRAIISDLAKMPHLLIGGTTGSGKSVGINSMIMSMLMRATPRQVRFIMIDPKRVEFSPYNGIPHLYVPVVTEAKEAASALSWGVAEMERRLKVFSKVGAKNIAQYNEKVAQEKQRLAELARQQEQAENASDDSAYETGGADEPLASEKTVLLTDNVSTAAPFSAQQTNDTTQASTLPDDHLPYIVIIIDELADLMMNVGKEVEFSISRIAQLARAAGIHLIVATQRPSANVVTGLIKANITNRMSFNVASGLDSRVILDTAGAEALIGNGDLLLSKPEFAKPVRIQGCFVSEEEIFSVVEQLKSQGEPEYHTDILKTNLITLGDSMPDGSGGSVEADDPKLWEAADIVVASGLGSTSNIQRKLSVGYARAGRIMDMLEQKGIVGAANGSRPREVLVDMMELEALKAFEQND